MSVHGTRHIGWVGSGWGQNHAKSGCLATRCGILEVSVREHLAVSEAKPNRLAFSFWEHLFPFLFKELLPCN